jgi:hypothetical protein
MTKELDLLNTPSKDFEEMLVELSTGQQIKTMSDLEKVINSIISTIPRINRNAIRREMESMNVKLNNNPTTSDLNEGLALSQAYKDRLAEIHSMALREFKLRERCVDMLFDAFNHLEAKGKSADVRRGEATIKYPMLLIHLEASETFLKEVEHVLANIRSAHESISRQVSIAQIQLQLGEIRRGSMPGGKLFAESEEITSKNKSGSKNWDEF